MEAKAISHEHSCTVKVHQNNQDEHQVDSVSTPNVSIHVHCESFFHIYHVKNAEIFLFVSVLLALGIG